ncbi:hypothetical protein Lcho_2188 [Leptothrix cholodnii SP-6]|uniref:Primase C-terminal 2 domain-containing protein n=1 Tax=Leptothrix cholodnii (strain ATCC 51168 / LMG 8142 / SP-6) TaxID=395495 RepID=B1Y3C6_LEPCP|nr:AAA family ATPase [Leptothrix cholodnii]ACB34454.1 hypothetical protein Lcho_2188 [Leptothrix cholodnii SP-6]
MTGDRIDLRHAHDALRAIDPGCSRDDWHKIGRAALAAGLSVDDLVEWSASAPNFKSERDVRAAFRTVNTAGGTGPGTLWKAAIDAGWKPPQDGKPQDRPRQQPRPHQQVAVRPGKPRQGLSAPELWARFLPAADAHGYIVAKQGTPEGLRVVPEGDPLRIAGQPMAGALAVPVYPLGSDTPVSIQFIPAPGAGKKLNLPGASMDGVFIVGELRPGERVHLVEGIGQAWACWKATGVAAVVAFGWGRVAGVAAELRQRDASARLVLVPDAGKEEDAAAIAAEVGAAVVTMPAGSPANFDANDYAQAEGFDALEVLLGNAHAAPEPAPHPLARFIDLDAEPAAPRWVIPGFIGHGLVIIAGAHGAGKTTALLPLALVAAGLHPPGDPLAPLHWRRVVYVTEDVEQARRILAGVLSHAQYRPALDLVRDRLRVVEARRLPPAEVVEVAGDYAHLRRDVDGVELLPLVVFDTKSAVLELEEENSNSEASAAVAMLKQRFAGLPVWLVGHVAKASMSRSDVANLSARGASAWEADANQVLYLATDGEVRYLMRGKTRFEARWTELEIKTFTAMTTARNEFGGTEHVVLRWTHPAPPEVPRIEARAEAQEQARKDADAELRVEIMDAVQAAWQTGNPLNRAGVKAKIRRRASEVTDAIENLLSEMWLWEVGVPAKERAHSSRAAFLVKLTTEQHDAVRAGEPLPPELLVIPATWKKQAAPPVPELVEENAPEVEIDPAA